MKRVYLFVGENQRLGGEVKKLTKAVGIVRRRGGEEDGGQGGELEVVDIVRYKICFTNRPEPVEGAAEGGEGGMDVDG
ncbi:chromosome transmission fidelity protein 8 [Podospora conica]|nr:chromosome transmission fidelity protein 8 [Schizothecium conicum]